MTQITLNPGQIQQLDDGPSLVECRDSSGKLIGYLHLAAQSTASKIPDFSAEQLEAYAQEPGGRGLGEILADLRKRR